MKRMLSHVALATGLFAAAAAVHGQGGGNPSAPATTTAAPASTNGPAPKIQFEKPIYEFGRAKGGDTVKYDFIFTNTGDALLEITSAQPSCGCTTAGDWSRKVEPGKTGVIPVQFNTGNYSGDVEKTVTVSSNDKSQPQVVLRIKGTVWRPIDIQPTMAYLSINAETVSNASTVVRIINNESEPLVLSAPESNNKLFVPTLTTNKEGKEYSVTIKTVPPLNPSNLAGQITMKSSSTNSPTVSISVWCILQQAVITSPTQITLPQGPLTNSWSTTISIRNQMTAPLTLSDPAVTAEGVEVKVNEVEPGRYFNISLTFPVGFKIEKTDKVEFHVKSNNAQVPTISVPILGGPQLTAVFSPRATQPAGETVRVVSPAAVPGRPVPLTDRAEQAVKAEGAH
jgi:hypothetical protein